MLHETSSDNGERDVVVTRSVNGTLHVIARLANRGGTEITRLDVSPARLVEWHGSCVPVRELFWPAPIRFSGAAVSVEECGDGHGEFAAVERSFRRIPGTEDSPRLGRPMVVIVAGGKPYIASTVEFVREVPATRGWVIPYMLRAYRSGDRIAHHLVFPQPWEGDGEPRADFYRRYRESRARAESFPELGDPIPTFVGSTPEGLELEMAMRHAPGSMMLEVRSQEGGPLVRTRVRVDQRRKRRGRRGGGGRAVELRQRSLKVADGRRGEIAEALTDYWSAVRMAFEQMHDGNAKRDKDARAA